MKTIAVVFVKEKLASIPSSTKRYTFNTESDVKVNDLIEVEGYKAKMQVAEIYNNNYKYYDVKGNLYENQSSLGETLPEIKEVTCTVVNHLQDASNGDAWGK